MPERMRMHAGPRRLVQGMSHGWWGSVAEGTEVDRKRTQQATGRVDNSKVYYSTAKYDWVENGMAYYRRVYYGRVYNGRV